MGMRQRIANGLSVEVVGLDLTGATNLEFYIKQRDGTFFQYTPIIVDSSNIQVNIPFDDAMKLSVGAADCQLALTTADGAKVATEIGSISVGGLLKESGYDG